MKNKTKKYPLLPFVSLIALVLITNTAKAQTWRKWIDPLYKSHTLINDSQFVKAENILYSKKAKIDTTHPIWHHSLCRIAQSRDSMIEALTQAKRSFIAVSKLQNETEKYSLLKEVYFMDVQYLSLYYRYLLIQKVNNLKSSENKKNNKNLIEFLLNEQVQLQPYVPFENAVLKITLPRLVKNLRMLNDSIDFRMAISSRSIKTIVNYLHSLSKDEKELQLLPNHLKSFYAVASDSLYNWSFQKTSELNTESAFLQYARTYPNSPYYRAALQNADNLAFQTCRISHQQSDYENYLAKYPNGRYRDQAKKLLRYLTVVPIPYLTASNKYVFVDSINHRPWIDSLFDFAYPFKMKYHTNWYVNASCLITGCALVMNTDSFGRSLWYYIEKDGKRYNEKSYDEIRQITANRAFVSLNERHGIIDEHGKEILPPIFEKLYFDTSNQIGVVFNGSKWALFNLNGRKLTAFDLDDVGVGSDVRTVSLETIKFKSNRIVCSKNDRIWVIDFHGKPHFIGDFIDVEGYQNEYAVAQLKKTQGFVVIDTIGRILSDTVERIEATSINGLFIIKFKNGTYALQNFVDSQLVWSIESTQKPLIANYWGNPQIAVYQDKNWLVAPYSDQGRFQKISGSIEILGDEIFIQRKRIKKRRSVTKYTIWYNPKSGELSKEIADDISVLNSERLVIHRKNSASLYDHLENEYPLFDEDSETQKVRKINAIYRTQVPTYFLAQTDSVQILIDTNGKIILTEYKGKIEALQNDLLLLTDENGIKKLQEINGGAILKGLDDYLENAFPGFHLINKEGQWVWVDMSKRLLRESI